MNPRPRGCVPVVHAATSERPDEADTIAAAEAVAEALSRLGYDTAIIALDLDVTPLVALAGTKPRAIFNLVEAMRGDDRLIAVVPAVLEHLGMAFTGGGADAFTATISKTRTKQLLQAAGLPVPVGSIDGSGCDAEARYIIKADSQHGSLGMDAGSVVMGADCTTEIAKRSRAYATRFFAEAYIPGREFNVAVLAAGNEPEVLPIQEIIFEDFADDQARIVDYDAKWNPEAAVYHTTPRRFGVERKEPALAGSLAAIAHDAWLALGLSGYARIDFRVDDSGAPFILEANVNPAITPDAGLVAAAAEAGLDYDALVGRIVDEAVNRADLRLSAIRHPHA